ncbi:hypothetical protein B9Z55_021539 [Caenorhabditis nigoni]|uniref:DNA-directed DNA polymerase n=1 Tax=Caenorhabditis nigoni TaxID=1611254 RepID=A0A2G5TSZ8_9PELO|nr:hypothetical protein B9Z55_021539 [Caenorhabditis nigoni]
MSGGDPGFPTKDELEFMNKYCEIIDATDLYQSTPLSLKLPPTRIQLRNLDQLPKETLDESVGKIFDIFIRHMLKKANANMESTHYWLNLRHPGYKEADGFWICHKTYSMANGHTLINTIADHVQSNDNIGLDDTMTLTMRIFTRNTTHGRGGEIPDKILRKFGLKRPHVRGDGYCLPKAVVIGKCWSDKMTAKSEAEANTFFEKYRSMTRHDKSAKYQAGIQENEAIKLLKEADMDHRRTDHSLDDLLELGEYLTDYRITVWTLEPGCSFPTIIFDMNEDSPGFISLFYHDDHFDFFHPTVEHVRLKFCFRCNSLVGKDHFKRCKALCKRCGFLECEKGQDSIYCSECNIHFTSRQCYDQHLMKKSTKALPHCKVWEKCPECRRIHQRDSQSKVEHTCFTVRFCKVCMKMTKGPHECAHAKPTEASKQRAMKKQETWRMIIYDFECQVTKFEKYQSGVYGMKHKPNLVCYRMICNKCMGEACEECESGYFSYAENDNVLEAFAKFLINNEKLKNAYVIAHNGGRYDHVLALEQLLKEEIYDQNFLLSGATILSATVKVDKKNTLTFRDSVKYLQMPLDQLPKAFNLKTKSKGTFPYMYNHPDHHHTTTPSHPPIEYYEPNRMSVKKRNEFLQWYEQVKDREFDFDKEILEYCQTDVNILTEAIVSFIQTCDQTNQGKWNPIIQCPTLASFLMFIMTHEHIQDGDIGYIPENGYPGRNNSAFALKYLLWLEQEQPGLKIQHKLRGEEYLLQTRDWGYWMDGYEAATKQVWEIHGCLFHGCPKCFPNRDALCPRNKTYTMGELHDRTMKKDSQIREAGYNLHAIWECEIREKMRKCEEMRNFFKRCRQTHTLRPREAMYGGRTQQFATMVAANEDYSVEYFDFCSEYPKVNMKSGQYPRGVPNRITSGFDSILEGEPLLYKGLIFCDVLPPDACPIPVLPYRANGKLMFPLCSSCANSSKIYNVCPHRNAKDRYLTGTWCHDELNLAIANGYKILKFHEVWNWDPPQWFTGGFFASFMRPLLKMKHASSGWPRDDMTMEEKQAHVDSIFENDGVELSVDQVESNPALRSLSKLFLNSTWGKFAQNPQKNETRMFTIRDYLKAGKFIDQPGYEPTCFEEWGDTHILVSRRPIKEIVTTSRFSNIVYGALTTSAARVDLFNAMKKIGADNLIYCDTDSVMFRQKRGTDPLAKLKGEALGQMTDEVPKGWKISEIVAIAPKVYSYKMLNENEEEKHVCKAKGITLNYETCEKVNFATMKELAVKRLSGAPEHIVVTRMRMKRGSNFLDGLESVQEEKRVRCVMDKGVFDAQGVLTPFGSNVSVVNDYDYYNINKW